ncbi:N-substituted formamide deformylase [Neobacillus rhizosphaerae]|uniref:N-substituted formamide deformylase n=1 Tax=Neobacillus rhizosphaerae TaxID=2880965 RepID=A0ABN8KX03_9BACI|nr:amidohydrolase [Neobacillus rhizosphaerae]CAH2716961.1 N-substituted formamide deformylase [Neobacillus rhizosphaerae]
MGKLWFGGTIYTLEKEGAMVEAIYTEGNRIIKTGEIAEIEEIFNERICERVDLMGGTMFPGFVDSHIHLIGHGETLVRLDLSELNSKDEVLAVVQEYAKQLNKEEWIIGEGWNENRWARTEMIHRKELDEISPENPVMLKRICRHAMIVNSKALELAGVTEETVCPPGGVLEKDVEDRLTGLIKDKAQDFILAAIPVVSEDYLQKAMRAAIKDLYQLGITGVHTEDLNYYGGFDRTFRTFKKVIEEEGLKLRAHLLVHHEVVEDMAHAGTSFLSGSEWIEFGAMKIFADGALGGRTALLSRPYHDAPEANGVAIFSQKELNDLVVKARKHNLPVAVHAIGDLAFEYVLNAIEEHPLVGTGRDRLIHAQILRQDLIERAKRLPVILDIQPVFLASDFPWVIDRVGKNRMEYCYAWKTLINEGLNCAGGSDAPIELPNPMFGIHAAVTRTNRNDSKRIVYGEEQALSVYEAINLFTKGSAYAACHEVDRGMIKEGFLADFTVLDEDIFNLPPSRISTVNAVMTVIGGDIVYKKE